MCRKSVFASVFKLSLTQIAANVAFRSASNDADEISESELHARFIAL